MGLRKNELALTRVQKVGENEHVFGAVCHKYFEPSIKDAERLAAMDVNWVGFKGSYAIRIGSGRD